MCLTETHRRESIVVRLGGWELCSLLRDREGRGSRGKRLDRLDGSSSLMSLLSYPILRAFLKSEISPSVEEIELRQEPGRCVPFLSSSFLSYHRSGNKNNLRKHSPHRSAVSSVWSGADELGTELGPEAEAVMWPLSERRTFIFSLLCTQGGDRRYDIR